MTDIKAKLSGLATVRARKAKAEADLARLSNREKELLAEIKEEKAALQVALMEAENANS